jgi:hypothetical protein
MAGMNRVQQALGVIGRYLLILLKDPVNFIPVVWMKARRRLS